MLLDGCTEEPGNVSVVEMTQGYSMSSPSHVDTPDHKSSEVQLV